MLNVKEPLKLKGEIWIHKINKDGSKTLLRNKKNVILNVGKDFLAAWLAAASQATGFMEFIAVGSDNTAAQATDTGVISQIGARKIGTLSTPGNTNIFQNTASFAAGEATGSWVEAALYSEVTGGTAFARQTFGILTKGALDTFALTWQISLG